jgi:hypothetical protein
MAALVRSLSFVSVALVSIGPLMQSPATSARAQQATIANPTPIHPSVPQLHLSDEQRAQIRAAVSHENSDVSFEFKASKGAKSFVPELGSRLPKGVTPHPLPRPLIYQLPVLREYKYVKFKDDILIVNPITKEIVDLFPQT